MKYLCLVIGSPIVHSLSPAMHNAGYKALGIDSQYSFLLALVEPGELAKFLIQARAKIHALSVTIPHKETILEYLDEIDIDAKEIGAVNTVLNKDGKLIGYNTDSPGAMKALKKFTRLNGKKVAVLGSGGTARAIIYGLKKEKAEITLFARNKEKAYPLAQKYGCNLRLWKERDKAVDSEIIINTTPIGREGENPPFSVAGINAKHIVFDVNYSVHGTPLINESAKKGATVIDGLELLISQGLLQFELQTGFKAPEAVMRNAIQSKTRIQRSL